MGIDGDRVKVCARTYFQTLVCFVTHEPGGGTIYSNLANATALPPTCVMLLH